MDKWLQARFAAADAWIHAHPMAALMLMAAVVLIVVALAGR